ncbi:MAG: NifB/NifX family molybdenum-iron cluster-binding protein [bacterium]
MKIAIPAEENSLNGLADDRFGRAKGFVIYDTETKALNWVDNGENAKASQGAGLKAAQHVIEAKVEVLISYDVGPKAFELLKENGIMAYRLDSKMKVKDAITMYLENKLKKINEGE